MIDLNDFAREVHDVAIDHGWYENAESMSVDTIIALIHDEWSEALEEYRARKPMVYFRCCNLDGVDVEVCDGGNAFGDCEKDFPCPYRDKKPEGIMIELIDGCIRILDFMAFKEWHAPAFAETPKRLIFAAKYASSGVFKKRCEDFSLPELVRQLHWYTAQYEMDDDMEDPMLTLLEAMGLALLWIEAHGRDPVELLLMKYEYNKSRPYKHGGKRI